MLIIFFIATLIFAMVASFTVLYNNYFKISDRTARKIEILGYVLLATSIIWTFYFKNILMDCFYADTDPYLAEKINYIYLALEKLCQNEGLSVASSFWEFKETDYVASQILATNIVEFILQLFSTICIAIGRFQELKSKKL